MKANFASAYHHVYMYFHKLAPICRQFVRKHNKQMRFSTASRGVGRGRVAGLCVCVFVYNIVIAVNWTTECQRLHMRAGVLCGEAERDYGSTYV